MNDEYRHIEYLSNDIKQKQVKTKLNKGKPCPFFFYQGRYRPCPTCPCPTCPCTALIPTLYYLSSSVIAPPTRPTPPVPGNMAVRIPCFNTLSRAMTHLIGKYPYTLDCRANCRATSSIAPIVHLPECSECASRCRSGQFAE